MDARDYSQKLEDLGLFEKMALKTNNPGKLIKLVRTHENREVRRLALFRLLNDGWEKLSDPEEREAIVQIALNDHDSVIRRDALEKLPYPEKREAIAQIALNDRDSINRRNALKKLSYPEERETIVKIALHDSDYSVRLCAVEMLPVQEYKDVYLQLIDECESVLRDKPSYSNSSSKKAANSLGKLYKKLNLSKEVTHTDRGTHNDYHLDGPGYQDTSHPDYNDYNGCGDYMYGSGHDDHHVDEGHEDYYRIIE